MPELPEVEVLKTYLNRVLPGRRVRSAEVRRPKSVRPGSEADFVESITGARFQSVERRAKFLIFHLEGRADNPRLLGHLGMTGRMYVQPDRVALAKHAAVVLRLDKGTFVFEDTRYFGRMGFDLSALERLGPEPLSDGFCVAAFGAALKPSRQAIKTRLLAQDVVVGVGNIYACEALFRAGVDPRTRCDRLRRRQVAALHGAIREVLGEAIRLGSTLPLDWAGKQGENGLFYFGQSGGGNYEERLLVYGREGETCRNCHEEIRRIVQANRSTFFCPRCQRK